ncbi:hypothetical protein [Streptomyces lavendulocolor]|uniref:hypothetical protein n=1 Tax=Streptomyces lavendulocolor TaxID=67316 RepID=UPI0031E3368E
MTTPDQGDPFAEAAGEAVQTAVMSVRLIMAIADAVRRHRQRQETGADEELPDSEQAQEAAKAELKDLLPQDIAVALMAGGDWPLMAQQMMALKRAGVDLEQLLPRIGEIAVSVRDAVAGNAQQVAGEGTERWERMLRETLPAGPVREAILSSPAWPEMAATMARLEERGVDVRWILASAHDEGLGVNQAVARLLGSSEVPAMSRGAMLTYGPLTRGLDIPRDYAPDDRQRALLQLGIGPHENARFVRMVREAMPGREQQADHMVATKHWPLLAARLAKLEGLGQPVEQQLAGLMTDLTWEQETSSMPLGDRLIWAAHHVLSYPAGQAPPVLRLKFDAEAARSRSSTVGPTKAPAAKGPAPAEPAVAQHRQEAAAKRGRTR